MSDHDQVKMTNMNYAPDRPKAENPVKVMDLSLRDGHQSLFATRGRTEDMIPVAELMDEVGFWAVETWGGATFDTMHRFLNEDPWERIRTLKRYFKKTPFSMLLRAQNLVGYRNYADDVANAFMDRACENGMDIFRTFDALNDYRNFQTVVPKIKEYGKHFQGCICYTMTEPRLGGEVYNLDYYVNKAKDLEAMGADSICVKDMAGLIAPYDAYADLVKALKAAVKVPIHLHSHFTSGMSPMSHLKAIEAGVDIIDTCMTPYAYRTSHAAIEPLVMALLGTNRDTGFDIRCWPGSTRSSKKRSCPSTSTCWTTPRCPSSTSTCCCTRPRAACSPTWSTSCATWTPWTRSARSTKNCPGAQGPGPDSPGDPHQPDRGHPDRQQRALRHAGRALQDDHRPGQGSVLRPLRQDRRAHQRGGSEKGPQGLRPRRGAHHLPARPKCWNRSWRRPRKRSATWPWTWTTWCTYAMLPGHRQEVPAVEVRQGRVPARSNPSPWMRYEKRTN
jgi:hypothetical protein